MQSRETIFALASGRGRAGVAVIRLSGPDVVKALRALTGKDLPAPRKGVLSAIKSPSAGSVLDRALVLWFPAPASFTGEDVAELHLHGGRAVVAAVTAALAALPGMRPAEAGEFTRRAFEHGKLDLTEAEGLADLVNAETEAQRRQALRQMEGELGALYEGWRHGLLSALAHVEADIDFSDDEDLPLDMVAQVRPTVSAILDQIGAHLDDSARGERLRDGFQVVILGAPNVGKSSLLNALARRDAAIVSETAGTTRDVIEVHMDLAGYPVTFADTAGLRDTADEIESEGIRRARARAEKADLKLLLTDARDWPALEPSLLPELDGDSLLLVNKCDLAALDFDALDFDVSSVRADLGVRGVWPISVATGTGLDEFLSALTREVVDRLEMASSPSLTRARHRQALEDCRDHLSRFLRLSGPDAQSADQPAAFMSAPELAAEDLRLANRALGRITGRVDVEDILDIVFSEFCIGK